jgi:DNA-binding NarL/FixJ family response regulator
MITTILADDHEDMRSLVRAFLDDEGDIEVVAEASETDVACALSWELKPAVLVLDLNMPGGPSLPAIRAVHQGSPQTAVVILSMQEDRATVTGALEAGALGYVLKQRADTELAQALRSVDQGETFVSAELEKPLLHGH